LSDSIYKYVDSSISQNNTNVSYINYAGLFDSSWKDNRDENIPDSDGDDLCDADEINWNVYKENNTYSDYADENYTGSDKTVDDFMKNSKDNFGIDVTITIITN